jgi:hypothetical protein
MIVQHRQWIASTGTHGDGAFEIHLPKIIGRSVFKTLPRTAVPGGSLRYQAVTSQDVRNSTGRRHLRLATIQQYLVQLASAPARMGSTQFDERLRDVFVGACGRGLRPTGAISHLRLMPKRRASSDTETPWPSASAVNSLRSVMDVVSFQGMKWHLDRVRNQR